MRFVLGIVATLALLGQVTSTSAQYLPKGQKCEVDVMINQSMKTAVVTVECGGIILTRQMALEAGRVALDAAGLFEYRGLYSADPFMPNPDGTTTVWILVVADPN